MTNKSIRTVHYVGHTKIFVYTREGYKKPYGLRVQGQKIAWYATEAAIDKKIRAMHKQFRHGKRAYNVQQQFREVVCQCGCDTKFNAVFTTRPPRFLNDDHRRAYRNATRVQARADKKLARLADERAAKRAAKLAAHLSRLKSSERSGGVGGMGAGKGGGGVPPSRSPADKGLYASEPEPGKTTKRRKLGLEPKAAE